MDWEKSKENFLPVKQGRDIHQLNTDADEITSKDKRIVLEKERR